MWLADTVTREYMKWEGKSHAAPIGRFAGIGPFIPGRGGSLLVRAGLPGVEEPRSWSIRLAPRRAPWRVVRVKGGHWSERLAARRRSLLRRSGAEAV
jgi:hypothetical protein